MHPGRVSETAPSGPRLRTILRCQRGPWVAPLSLHSTSLTPPGTTLRHQLRAKRRSLSAREQRHHAAAATRLLILERAFRASIRIALYLAVDGELDPMPLLTRRPARTRQWYLPVLRRHQPGRLWLARWRPGEPLRPNRYGIGEPARRHRRLHHPRQLDLILLPLVGFDADCNRLGMGAGFYDRSLAFLRQRCCWRRPRLIGLAHECQRLPSIDPRPWDIPLDAVVTEARVYHRTRPNGEV